MREILKALKVSITGLFILLLCMPAFAQDVAITDIGAPNGVSYTVDVNDAGQVLGNFQNYSGITPGLTSAFIWQDGAITGIGVVEGGTYTVATDISNSGQVVGYGDTWYTAAGKTAGFSWLSGVMSNVGTLSYSVYDTNTKAHAVSETGQVVGESVNGSGQTQAFSWLNSHISGLPLFGSFGMAYDVNDAGQVVGWSGNRAVMWEGTTMTILNTQGGVTSVANSINNAGQVLGHSYNNATGYNTRHAFIWQSGVTTDLGTLGGNYSYDADINEAGQVVGSSATATGEEHAFLWQGGAMTDLGTLGGSFSHAVSINEAGQVVGSSATAAGEEHAFLWQDGVMTDLGTLGGMSRAQAINNTGLIAGYSYLNGSVWHAVVWETPAMVIGVIPQKSGNEGDEISLNVQFSDEAADAPHMAQVEWGDESSSSSTVYETPGVGGGTVEDSHVYADNGVYNATLTVYDQSGASETARFTVTVGNLAPVVTAGQDQTAVMGSETSFDLADFDDAGINDTHTATVNWGDGNNTAGIVSESGGSGSVSGTHAYTSCGTYVVTVNVTDKDGASAGCVLNIAVSVNIDAVPYDPTNTVSLKHDRTVAVAILGSPGFDASGVDVASVTLDGVHVKQSGGGRYDYEVTDVNSDGIADMVCNFKTSDLNYGLGVSTVNIDGLTGTGAVVHGTDFLNVTQ